MASDATILDAAPVTPAHKFAWRALRGFVYGSPESSPEQVHSNRAYGDQQENRRRPVTASPRSSPSKKRVSMPAITSSTTITNASVAAPSLSPPKKRKRDTLQVPVVVSPTKSILRTPGAAPTPRAKSLRDVNVTFKSVSPEARMEGGAVPLFGVRSRTVPEKSMPVVSRDMEELEKQVDELWEEMERSLLDREESERESLNRTPPAVEAGQGKLEVGKRRGGVVKGELRKDPPIEVSQEKPGGDEEPVQVDHQDYARRTEREVKRLLRQHKKLRDYAQRADEQNVALQAMVATLQKENAQLKMRLEKVGTKTDNGVPDEQKESSKGVSSNKQEHQLRAEMKATARSGTMHQDKTRENRREEISLKDHNSLERSLRGSMASFSIHEDDVPVHKQRKTTDNLPPKTITNRDGLSQKQRSTTLSAMPSSHANLDKEPQSNHEPISKRGSNSLRGTKDSKASTATKPAAVTQPSPFSLTTLAARLEPTPGPAPRAPSNAAASSTAINPNHPPPLTNSLNMSPTRVAAARARLQARRLASSGGRHGASDTATTTAAPLAVASGGSSANGPHSSQDDGAGHHTSIMLRDALAEQGLGFVRGGAGAGGGGVALHHDAQVEESSVDWAQM